MARSATLAEPDLGVDRRTALPDLEVQVRAELRVGDADRAERLTLGHARTLGDLGAAERAVDRVVAAAVLHDHGEPVGAEPRHLEHLARGDREDRRPSGRLDPNAVPPHGCVVRALLAA